MRIVVLAKEVPDTYGDRKLNLETGLADRGASEAVIDEIGERALEVALSHADAADDVEVTVLSVSPESATSNIRKLLAMGAGSATHVVDEGLRGADLGLTAEVLAAALRQEEFDLVIAGDQSTDGMAGMIPAMISELLEIPALTSLSEVHIEGERVTGVRRSEGSVVQLAADLPAVISVTEQLPDARFPNFKGIMAAKKKPLTVKTLDELGVDPEDMTPSRAIMIAVAERPPRQAGVKVNDDGTAAGQLAAALAENRLI